MRTYTYMQHQHYNQCFDYTKSPDSNIIQKMFVKETISHDYDNTLKCEKTI